MTAGVIDLPQQTAAPVAADVRRRVATSSLKARDLTVRFGDLAALRDVSIDLDGRSIHAVIGPNGAGKTTLFNAISGFTTPTSGRVHLDGADVTAVSPDRLAGLGLARSFQICSIFPNLSVADNIRTALPQNVRGLQLLRLRSRPDENESKVQYQLATLSGAHWHLSGEAVLMALIGGIGTFDGPLIGATVLVTMQHFLSSFGAWILAIQGAIFVLCVLLFRDGLLPHARALAANLRNGMTPRTAGYARTMEAVGP